MATRPKGPQVCGTNCDGKQCMPDDQEDFKAENKADSCCDFCCERCEDAICRSASPVKDWCKCGKDPNFLSDSCGETGAVGQDYKDMVSTIKAKLDKIGTKNVHYKIAGFAWFQGWTDASKSRPWIEHEYEDNMVDFVKSVRTDFIDRGLYSADEPALPFIISGPGMDGYGSRGKANVCNAQRRAADREELNETTIYVESRIFAAKYACLNMDDTACAGLSDAGCNGKDNKGCACAEIIKALKKENPDYKKQCGYKVNEEQGQHWSWNGRSYFKVGQKMGEVTLTLTLTLTLNT